MLASNGHLQLDPASTLRNKYNTLTPAEAKKLNRFLGTGTGPRAVASQQQSNNLPRQPPLRTASVLHKPRAPPIVVTNLDTTVDQLDSRSLSGGGPNYHHPFGSNRSLATANSDLPNTRQQQHYNDSADDKTASLLRSTIARSSSVCPQVRDPRRHTINYGRASVLNSRSSLYNGRTSELPSSPDQHHQYFSQHQQRAQASPALNESTSNLSFKSSVDTADFAHESYRFQTMSVDLGKQYYNMNNGTSSPAKNSTTMTIKPQHLDPMLRAPTIGRLKYNTMSSTSSRMFSDESYSSCRSEVSSTRSCNATPTKFYNTTVASSDVNRGHNNIDKRKPPRSDSKVSLSNSTYNKMFQSPFANFKKLFRNMPRPFTNGGPLGSRQATATPKPENNVSSLDPKLYNTSVSNNYTCRRQLKLDNSCQSDVSLADISISDSISQISLNKSQSPPVYPPPPGELKSMSYMESAINYSNYDEFTRARNERLNTRQQLFSTKLNSQNGFASLVTGQGDDNQHQQHSNLKSTNGLDEMDSWQLTSLPVYYERNLTTVFEEKQASCDNARDGQQSSDKDSKWAHNDLDQQQMIKPPMDFDDNGQKRYTDDAVGGDDTDRSTFDKRQQSDLSETNKLSQSLTSSTTADSVLDYQQQDKKQEQQRQQACDTLVPAKPYRFSFAQPLPSNPDNNLVSVVV